MNNNTQPLNILIIDDESAVRTSLKLYLEDYGYNILEAKDGQEGIDTFEKQALDTVIVDLMMPKVDGHQVLEHISSIAPDLPLIATSGTGQIGQTVKALRNGAWDYIMKPITDLGILRHSILKGIERARLLKENRAYKLQSNRSDNKHPLKPKQTENHFEALIEAANDIAFVTTDLQGKDSRILSFSHGAEILFGISSEKACGQPIEILYPPQSIKEIEILQKKLKEQRLDLRDQRLLRHTSGTLFPAIHSLHPLYNEFEQLNQILMVSTDLSSKKGAQENANTHKFIQLNNINTSTKNTFNELKSNMTSLLLKLTQKKYITP